MVDPLSLSTVHLRAGVETTSNTQSNNRIGGNGIMEPKVSEPKQYVVTMHVRAWDANELKLELLDLRLDSAIINDVNIEEVVEHGT